MRDVFFDFEHLLVYQKSLKFVNRVFDLSGTFARHLQFSLGDQIRRAALSICNNIAEGSRKSGRAKVQFYNYALDSTRECIPMIQIAYDQGQMDEEKVAELRRDCVEISRMLYGLIQAVH